MGGAANEKLKCKGMSLQSCLKPARATCFLQIFFNFNMVDLVFIRSVPRRLGLTAQ